MLFNYLVAWLLFYVSSFQPFFLLSDQTRFVFSIYSRNYNSRRLSSLWGVGIMFLLLVLWYFVVVVVGVLIVITSFFTSSAGFSSSLSGFSSSSAGFSPM